jgi:hypothetical protein
VASENAMWLKCLVIALAEMLSTSILMGRPLGDSRAFARLFASV